MKNCSFLLLAFFGLGPAAFSQAIFNPFFQNLETKTCPFDTTKKVIWPEGWAIFQTQNGDWNGPVDSSRCISASKIVGTTFGAQVDLSQMDSKKPLFMRGQSETGFDILPPNAAYVLNLRFTTSPNARWVADTNCPNGLCTGIAIEIAIPDSLGNAFSAIRPQVVSADPPPAPAPNGCFYSYSEGCVPTEFFAEQRLENVVLKWTFDDSLAIGAADFLQVSGVDLFGDPFSSGTLTDFSIPDDAQTTVITSMEAVADFPSGWGSTILGLYDPTDGYPSGPHPSFIEGSLAPNPSVQKTISLYIAPFFTFLPQPFTYLRGGLVEGSDSLRHTLELVNFGGTVCLAWVDLVFPGPSKYVHAGGSIELSNQFSCMQFRRGAELRIQSSQTLHYGTAGTGMLQLCSGSKITIEKGARLVIDCVLGLGECGDPTRPSRVEVDLLPGGELVFSENGSLFNQYSENQALRLSVNMLGGTIDDSALSPADRLKIERVWPVPSGDFSANVAVAPTLFSNEITVEMTAAAAGFLQFELFDAVGRAAFSTKIWMEKGWQTVAVSLPDGLASGPFFLAFSNEKGERAVKKVVKI